LDSDIEVLDPSNDSVSNTHYDSHALLDREKSFEALQPCGGYVAALKNIKGGLLNLNQVYPFHRHGTFDEGVRDWVVTTSGTGVIYSNQCKGSVDSDVASCEECQGLRHKVKLTTVLENACKDYCDATIWTNNQYLSHRQLVQKAEANRAATQALHVWLESGKEGNEGRSEAEDV
jgi:hypothetical protein